jgi:hypothetical protein
MPKTSSRFPAEYFKKHIVGTYSFTLLANRPVEFLVFREPGTGVGLMRFLRLGNELLVSGDYDNASYSWPSEQTMAWMADTNFHYFHGKCSSSPSGRIPKDWEGEEFIKDGRRRVKEAIEARFDEDYKTIPEDHPLLVAWNEAASAHNVENEYEARSFLENSMPFEVAVKEIVPEKYRPTSDADDVGEFFFGKYWHEYFPSGYTPSWTTIIHHGALRMAVQRLHDQNPEWWEQVQKDKAGFIENC